MSTAAVDTPMSPTSRPRYGHRRISAINPPRSGPSSSSGSATASGATWASSLRRVVSKKAVARKMPALTSKSFSTGARCTTKNAAPAPTTAPSTPPDEIGANRRLLWPSVKMPPHSIQNCATMRAPISALHAYSANTCPREVGRR